MTDIKTRLTRTETIHFPRNPSDDHSEDREVLVNPDGPEAAEYIAELEAALTPNETGAATALQTFTDPRQPEPPNP